ncbi:hypothetical protein [Nocardia ignorata]|uniref:Uncharacterized protein n=1 Tax=Nocardia ignorata TaxID=145285 RepID=A0A4V3CN16_NOCIG|nr:hypothetical protein [Nocardia ignorata]TDP32332.1 hypothetical protein DFR75_106122 [Nocardia ignorata]
MSPRLLFVSVALLGLLSTPVVVPMLLAGEEPGDAPTVVSSVNPLVPGCSMFCDDGPAAMPLPGPEAPGCVAFCNDGPVSLPMTSSGVK